VTFCNPDCLRSGCSAADFYYRNSRGTMKDVRELKRQREAYRSPVPEHRSGESPPLTKRGTKTYLFLLSVLHLGWT
jgi:hypothetical protein